MSKEEELQVYELKVRLQCCKGCSKKVKKWLEKVEGVSTITIDDKDPDKVIVIGKVDLAEKLIKRLAKKGKKAELLASESDDNKKQPESGKAQRMDGKKTEKDGAGEGQAKAKQKDGKKTMKDEAGEGQAKAKQKGGKKTKKDETSEGQAKPQLKDSKRIERDGAGEGQGKAQQSDGEETEKDGAHESQAKAQQKVNKKVVRFQDGESHVKEKKGGYGEGAVSSRKDNEEKSNQTKEVQEGVRKDSEVGQRPQHNMMDQQHWMMMNDNACWEYTTRMLQPLPPYFEHWPNYTNEPPPPTYFERWPNYTNEPPPPTPRPEDWTNYFNDDNANNCSMM